MEMAPKCSLWFAKEKGYTLIAQERRHPMSQAIVNPEELQQFAQNLKQFNTQLQDSMSRLVQAIITAFRVCVPASRRYRSS
jgi:hypothetical protein